MGRHKKQPIPEENIGIKCRRCGSEMGVWYVRNVDRAIRRCRKCSLCGTIRLTYEYVVPPELNNPIKRTNAEKRMSVKLSIKKYPELSSRGIAEMCGVDHMTVLRVLAKFSKNK